jgi:hypothetical protein
MWSRSRDPKLLCNLRRAARTVPRPNRNRKDDTRPKRGRIAGDRQTGRRVLLLLRWRDCH